MTTITWQCAIIERCKHLAGLGKLPPPRRATLRCARSPLSHFWQMPKFIARSRLKALHHN